MNPPVFRLRILLREGLIAVLTGLLAFGISLLLTPGATAAAAAFAIVAAAAAGALDTLYFHLLFLLRQAPAYEAEHRDQHSLAEVRRRLLDGSIQMREALIRRFESDHGRTAALSRAEGRSKRQLKEAKRRLQARLWVIERVVTADQWLAAADKARSEPEALDRCTEQADEMVDAYLQVRSRQNFTAAWGSRFAPQRLAVQVRTEWERLVAGT